MKQVTLEEYWFLDLVVCNMHHIYFTRMSHNDDDMEDYSKRVFNRIGVPISIEDHASTLLSLQSRGWIAFEYDSDLQEPKRIELSLPKMREILSRSGDYASYRYGLTSTGGSVWEEYSQPDWDLYVASIEAIGRDWFDSVFGEGVNDGSDTDPIANRRHIRHVSMNRSFLEERLLYYQDENLIVPGSLRWRELIPWNEVDEFNASYWKVLPIGHELGFSCYSDVEVEANRGTAFNWYEFIHSLPYLPDWYTHFISKQRCS